MKGAVRFFVRPKSHGKIKSKVGPWIMDSEAAEKRNPGRRHPPEGDLI